MDTLDAEGRWAMLKLITGELRVGLSARLAKTGAASLSGRLRPRSLGLCRWRRSGTGWSRPMWSCSPGWRDGAERPSAEAPGRFRPMMLSQPIDEALDFDAAGSRHAYAAEWKWDGIRVQAIREGGRGAPVQPHRRRNLGQPSQT